MTKVLAIELGSTRIKSVLVDENARVLAQGAYEWENSLVDGLWSYSLDEAEVGVRTSYANLVENYGREITSLDGIGISGMMHGYLAFDEEDNLLAPFRTWRNNNAEAPAKELTELFKFHIPIRWSVSQYYYSVVKGMVHVKKIKHLNTLAGYVHYRLTGERVLGVNDASGMFPVLDNDYDGEKIQKFNALLKEKGVFVDFKSLLPVVKVAGENAGYLTEEGARWLDESGKLSAGIPLCPPEGDMGTGMVATNCIAPRTANISSGTSVNVTAILEKPLSDYYDELDVAATPCGDVAVIVHGNNCTTEINEWVSTFDEVLRLFGVEKSKGEVYEKLFRVAIDSDEQVGKMLTYNFLASEPLAGVSKGTPIVMRAPDGVMNLANFMQAQIYSAVSSMALGVGILEKEGLKLEKVLAHGGFYKTDFVGQSATSAVLNAPVTVMQTASEGGAWGMALLALYMLNNEGTLSSFLDKIFKDAPKTTVTADEKEKQKWNNFFAFYRRGLATERKASDTWQE